MTTKTKKKIITAVDNKTSTVSPEMGFLYSSSTSWVAYSHATRDGEDATEVSDELRKTLMLDCQERNLTQLHFIDPANKKCAADGSEFWDALKDTTAQGYLTEYEYSVFSETDQYKLLHTPASNEYTAKLKPETLAGMEKKYSMVRLQDEQNALSGIVSKNIDRFRGKLAAYNNEEQVSKKNGYEIKKKSKLDKAVKDTTPKSTVEKLLGALNTLKLIAFNSKDLKFKVDIVIQAEKLERQIQKELASK
tara:strand:+ start:361 stop:1107 length:747 start_codon:yes stop_codon:yes gene_type:complete